MLFWSEPESHENNVCILNGIVYKLRCRYGPFNNAVCAKQTLKVDILGIVDSF